MKSNTPTHNTEEEKIREEWGKFNKEHDWIDPEDESADWWFNKLHQFYESGVRDEREKATDKVEMIEIWQPTEEGGGIYHFEKKQNLKLVALIVGGIPVTLEKDFYLERKYINKFQADSLINKE